MLWEGGGGVGGAEPGIHFHVLVPRGFSINRSGVLVLTLQAPCSEPAGGQTSLLSGPAGAPGQASGRSLAHFETAVHLQAGQRLQGHAQWEERCKAGDVRAQVLQPPALQVDGQLEGGDPHETGASVQDAVLERNLVQQGPPGLTAVHRRHRLERNTRRHGGVINTEEESSTQRRSHQHRGGVINTEEESLRKRYSTKLKAKQPGQSDERARCGAWEDPDVWFSYWVLSEDVRGVTGHSPPLPHSSSSSSSVSPPSSPSAGTPVRPGNTGTPVGPGATGTLGTPIGPGTPSWVTEAKGLGQLLVGMVTCDSVDFFVSRPQLMLVDVTELGTVKLQLQVTWKPLHSALKILSTCSVRELKPVKDRLLWTTLGKYHNQCTYKPCPHPTSAPTNPIPIQPVPLQTLSPSNQCPYKPHPTSAPTNPVQPVPLQTLSPSNQCPYKPRPTSAPTNPVPIQPVPLQTPSNQCPYKPCPHPTSAPTNPVQPVPLQTLSPSNQCRYKPRPTSAPTNPVPIQPHPLYPNSETHPTPDRPSY
ncbi:hypothetical protein CRUP_016283 [Coryphaenoides rupestris]|nr:hypothetical protein CRUP_016283 [Coryphaenoides rupestris]